MTTAVCAQFTSAQSGQRHPDADVQRHRTPFQLSGASLSSLIVVSVDPESGGLRMAG